MTESGAPKEAQQGEAKTPAAGSETGHKAEAVEIVDIPTAQFAVRERGPRIRLVNEEFVRAGLAVLLLLLVAAVILIALMKTETWADTKELLDIALPALTGLLGSAVGFYFGTRS